MNRLPFHAEISTSFESEDDTRRIIRAAAVKLWAAYHLACDEFDGTAGPAPPTERIASMRYARARRAQLDDEARMVGVPPDVMHDAEEAGLREAERIQRASGFDPEWFAYIDFRERAAKGFSRS